MGCRCKIKTQYVRCLQRSRDGFTVHRYVFHVKLFPGDLMHGLDEARNMVVSHLKQCSDLYWVYTGFFTKTLHNRWRSIGDVMVFHVKQWPIFDRSY